MNPLDTNEVDLLADLLYEVSSDFRRSKFATVFTFFIYRRFSIAEKIDVKSYRKKFFFCYF